MGGEHEGKDNPSRRQDRIRTGVDADVALERTGVGELALAVHTHVRLLPAVDPQVPLQVTWEQGRLKDTGSSSPFSSFPEPQKLPRESLVLFREQGLRKDQRKLAAPCLGSGNNVEAETARTSTQCLRGSKDSSGIIPTLWLCSRLGKDGRRPISNIWMRSSFPGSGSMGKTRNSCSTTMAL